MFWLLCPQIGLNGFFFSRVGQVRQFERGLITHIFCVAVISDIGIHEVFDLLEVIEIFSAYDPCSNVWYFVKLNAWTFCIV